MRPSVARSQQLIEGPYDDHLTLLARMTRPGIRHWWGRRRAEGKNGALCYLCYEFIATWSSQWPMTEAAKSRIAVHRLTHIRELLDGSPTKPEE